MNDRPPQPPPSGTYKLEDSLRLMKIVHEAYAATRDYYRWRNIPRRFVCWLFHL